MSEKFLIFSGLLFALIFIGGCGDNESKSSSSTIAVLAHSDFVPDRTEIADRAQVGLPEVLSDRMLEHLTNSKRFVPVERAALRRIVLEQRFGQNISNTYLDQTLDKAISAMTRIDNGGSVNGVRGGGLAPSPLGSGISGGTGTVGSTGALADYNDILKDFQDLGSAVGADYLVLGNLEKLTRDITVSAVPYSQEGRLHGENKIDARMNLRVIDSKKGTIIGATSLRTRVSNSVFTGQQTDADEFSFYDLLGRLAALKVLDMIYPARIVNTEPLVISRGDNDGVQVGDKYRVEREGKEIKDASGQQIAHLQRPVGQVRVVDVQENIAVVEVLGNADIQQDDLVFLDTPDSEQTRVQVEQAQTPLGGSSTVSSRRPRVAVVLIRKGSTETPEDHRTERHTPLFTDTIISRLTQSRRFQVLDRQEVDQLLNEQTLIAMREGDSVASAVGTLQGADYLVYGSLADLTVADKDLRLPGSKRTFVSKTGFMEGNMRIVDARSGQIMESRKISVERKLEADAGESRNLVNLADAYAEQVTLMLLNKLYPIRIAALGGDGTVYINRGDDGGLFVDEILDVYRLGMPVIDPETGVQLGQEEIASGQVKIYEVEDARSKGRALTDAKLAEGDLLKRAQQQQTASGVQPGVDQGLPESSGAMLADRGKPGGTARGTGEKITLAVGQLKTSSAAKTNSLLTPERSRRLTNDLMFKLTDSNRFKVLERQEVDQLLTEKEFDAIVSGGEMDDRVRQLIGADYLIHGDIDNFYVDSKSEKVPYLDEWRTTATAIADGVFRIVDVHNGAVMAGDRLRVSFQINDMDNMESVASRLQDEFSTQAVAEILLRLFPIKVLGVAGDGLIFLNRGRDAGLEVGNTFNVMREGEQLIDPDTGRVFGSAETQVASIQLVAVETARAKAALKTGGDVQAGDIVRKQATQAKAASPAPAYTPNW